MTHSSGTNFLSARLAKRAVLGLVALGLILLVPLLALAGPGDPVRSFSGDGISQTGPDTRLLGAAVQPDGKLVAVGDQGADAGNPRLLVARFTATGAPDRSFSGDGVFLGDPGTSARGVAIQPNGRIVVAGKQTSGNTASSFGMLVLRLTAGGGPDRSFSGDGEAIAFAGGGDGRAIALDGTKVVAAGSASADDGFARVAVARFNANGSADRSFSGDGLALLDFGRISIANGVAVDGSHRIFIGGSQRNDLQTTLVLAARLRANGTPDSGFGGNVGLPGLYVEAYSRNAGYSSAFDLELAPGGKVLLAGAATNGSSDPEGADAIAVRLTSGGRPDGSFSGDGIAYLPATTSKTNYTRQEPFPGAQGIALSGSTIVLGGYFDELTAKRLAVWGLRQNGALLNSFGTSGRTVTEFGDGNAQLRALAAGSDGDLFGVGDANVIIDAPRGLAARFDGSGAAAKCAGKAATMVGTSGRDVLRGTGKVDVVAGMGGNDQISTLAGNDIACGGAGADRILGGAGNDTLRGEGGNDFIRGGPGRDRVSGGGGRNNVRQ